MLLVESSSTLHDIEKLMTPQFWQALAPNLHIAKPDYNQVPTPLIPDDQRIYLQQLMQQEGYFHGSLGSWHAPLADLTAVIQQLSALGLPPVFMFVYDETWQLAYQLSSTISCFLGEQYWMLPDFWAWCIDPAKAEAGWKPHRDKGHKSLRPDGTPSSLTAWIPLTQATTLNGCMYMLPADRDPVYGTPNDGKWEINYPDIRALPASPGEFLMWNQAVLHWGSRSSQRAAGQPRMSCAFEFQRCDIPAWNMPLIPPNSFLSLNQRLNLIGKQILQYQHMYPLSDFLSELAKRVLV
jgi:Phytanoyl-CoA dioxygenase (PhyH)